MPAPQTEWTPEMLRNLPEDGNLYEVLDGTLVMSPAPAWQHQAMLLRLVRLVDDYVRHHRLGWTMLSPADIELSPRTIVQPDLFVVPDEGTGEPRSWTDVRNLLLVVEGISPVTARNDRGKKRVVYQKAGIPQYWILDPDSRLVERWQPDDERPEVITDILEWYPRPEIPPLLITLPYIFGPEK